MKPLTIEQLREMDDQPVKVQNLEYPSGEKLPTGVVTMYDPNDSDNGVDVGCGFYSIREYGRTWVAYPYFKVDREAWKPCMNCEEPCRTCMFNETRKCRTCKEFGEYMAIFEYCPKCGRPMTESAWGKLEERIRGCLK